LNLPVTRQLLLSADRNVDPHMPRLLAIHRACCLILHYSGAAGYIDDILDDWDKSHVMSDGTTELGALISLRLRISEHPIVS
jgi:hypothetical protein